MSSLSWHPANRKAPILPATSNRQSRFGRPDEEADAPVERMLCVNECGPSLNRTQYFPIARVATTVTASRISLTSATRAVGIGVQLSKTSKQAHRLIHLVPPRKYGHTFETGVLEFHARISLIRSTRRSLPLNIRSTDFLSGCVPTNAYSRA